MKKLTNPTRKVFALIILVILSLFYTKFALASTECPATGGALTEVDSYCINTFTDNGTFIPPAGGVVADVLVVGGGGGGGANSGGGGGGGGYEYVSSFYIPAGEYSVTIGEGGSGGIHNGYIGATNGGDSVFYTVTAAGGGGGADEGGSALSGGSGGGGSFTFPGGADGNILTTVPSQGNGGGAGRLGSGQSMSGDGYNPGGGGGAGSAGEDSTMTKSGDGGDGVSNSISGVSVTYSGGGGGGADLYRNDTNGAGGAGGGGAGGYTSPGVSGLPNSGGGGGGGSNAGAPGGVNFFSGGSGGSGIVIIRYPKIIVSNIGVSSGGGFIYGCKDPTALNYNYFSASEPSLCKYSVTPTANSSSQSSAVHTLAIPVAFFTTRILKLNMIGADIKALQIYLNTHSYIISKTGAGSLNHENTYFGLKTKAAVILFQKTNGLAADGIVGPRTKELMK